jgi:hypothetical protein
VCTSIFAGFFILPVEIQVFFAIINGGFHRLHVICRFVPSAVLCLMPFRSFAVL